MADHSAHVSERTLACGCTQIERASVEEASNWLLQQIEGHAHIEISVVVGGDRCSFWRSNKAVEDGQVWPKKAK